MVQYRMIVAAMLAWTIGGLSAMANEFALQLRQQKVERGPDGTITKSQRVTREEIWPASKTAIIVCDVWDYHHCLNAVRRLNEFGPRLNEVLTEARRRGATIIHAPSDCMEAYADHPARRRAVAMPVAASLPSDIRNWCSQIPIEGNASYPIDQSDGGEDDDPAEHSQWAGKLKALGRNPGMPWKTQSDMIAIDADKDFISDRGDEVWNVLESRGITHVILTGVHVNMCVLGRPFGLRQMARNGKQVVLMRDMTDAMYNPQRWPYVDHYTGNDLVISHIEQFICPTVTSDQILGGSSFVFSNDTRPVRDVAALNDEVMRTAAVRRLQDWRPVRMSDTWKKAAAIDEYQGVAWYRCAVKMPKSWLPQEGLTLTVAAPVKKVEAWCNGNRATLVDESAKSRESDKNGGSVVTESRLRLPLESFVVDDHNLIVIRIEHAGGRQINNAVPLLSNGKQKLPLDRRWQMRQGDQMEWSNIPLPAKFGIGADLVYEPR